jgi:hypothetical protein
MANAADGGTAGLAFPQVSAYWLRPPVAYAVRIVIGAPGIDCSVGGLLVADTNVPATVMTAGSNTTVALIGQVGGGSGGDGGLQLKLLPALPDDVVGPQPKVVADADPVDRFALRFVHAAPGVGPVNLGTEAPGGKVSTVLSHVSIGQSNPVNDAGPALDSNGYLVQSAWTATPVHVWPYSPVVEGGSPLPDLFPAASITAAGGSVLTLVLTGSPSVGSIQLLECVDDAARTNAGAGTPNAYSLCKTTTVSTCGNGKLEAFEDCDCGSSTNTGTDDPQCASTSANATANGPLPQVCSTACRLN